MELKSFPKVNIGLYVSSKREDGYHNLISIFQKVYSVFDTIIVSLSSSDSNEIHVKGLEKYVPEQESSVYKMAKLWLEKQENKYFVDIEVIKKVPVQTGLGTPSSNAATTLLALEELVEKKLSEEELMALGRQIGSDVCFFLCNSDAAVVSSRGDVVKPIRPRDDLKIELLFVDNEKVSTKEAYRQLDLRRETKELPSEEELVSMYYSEVSKWDFTNDFELVNKRPNIKLSEGQKLMLSGSGSCWFTVS